MKEPKKYQTLSDLAKSVPMEDMTLCFCQFLDDFKRAPNKEALISEEPVWHHETDKWKYAFAATAHKLANENKIEIPAWTLKPEYISPIPQYAFGITNPEAQEYLRSSTPYEYAMRNLFVGANAAIRA